MGIHSAAVGDPVVWGGGVAEEEDAVENFGRDDCRHGEMPELLHGLFSEFQHSVQ